MTPDERSILQQFLQDLGQARGAAKDREAEAMIARAMGDNPDAAYLLVQHATLSDQALHAAQAQIDQMQAQLPAPQSSSFLGGAQPAPQGYSPSYADGGQVAPAWSGQPVMSSPLSSGGGLANFLRNAGQIAAGVAAGDFLVEGLSNIFGGRQSLVSIGRRQTVASAQLSSGRRNARVRTPGRLNLSQTIQPIGAAWSSLLRAPRRGPRR